MVVSAWVESPLQLLGALEHARCALAGDDELVIIPRSGDAQLELTATHLAGGLSSPSNGMLPASSSLRTTIGLDRRVMTRRAFSPDQPWLVGDVFSGQVQSRLDRAEPSHLTIVDDGAITRRLAALLHAGEPMLRPRAPRLFPRMRRELAARTTRHLRRLAAEGRVSMTTYFEQADPAVTALTEVGIDVVTHRFDATRALGLRAEMIPRDAHVLLGSAAVADALTDPSTELSRIAALAAEGPVAYLPHRREPHWFVRDVSRLPEVVVVPARLPIELALAGTARALTVVSPASTALDTLPIVLRGTGSRVSALPTSWAMTS